MNKKQLILVDEKDNFLGKYASKSRCHCGDGLHHRAFTILILNQKDEVLLQKRKHKLWDGFWDLTNSHPFHQGDIDETYEEAVSRCLENEWGVIFPVKKLFDFNYFAKYGDFCENEFCVCFSGEYNGEVFPNPKIIYKYKWIPLKKLFLNIKTKPNLYTPWAKIALEKYEERFF